MTNETDNLIRRFLLGELPEEQRAALEERLFKEDEFYSEVLAIQEELADDCVNGGLSTKERSQLEDYFMRSPRRQKRVEFAAALSQALVQPAQPERTMKTPWWESLFGLVQPRLALAATAAAIALLIFSGWLWLQNRRLSSSVDQAKAEKESLIQRSTVNEDASARRAKELEDQIAALKAEGGHLKASIDQKEKELEELRRAGSSSNSRVGSALAAFILAPGLTRGSDEPEKLIIPPATSSLRLQLDLEREENYQAYVAEIRTARGNLVWSKSGLTMQKTNYGQAVNIFVPSSLLLNGEYEITLKGAAGRDLEAVGYYYFMTLHR